MYTFLTPWLEARLKGNIDALEGFFGLLETESGIITEQSDCIECPIPEGASSFRPSLDQVSLSWNTVTEAESYDLRGRVVGNSGWLTSSSPDPVFFAGDLPLDQEIEWQVRAVCDGLSNNVSPYSDSQFFDTSCPTPEGLVTTVLGPNSASATWSPVSFAESYILHGGLAGQGQPLSVEVGTTSFTTSILQANTAYEWSVTARCTADPQSLLSQSSQVQSFLTDLSMVPEENTMSSKSLVFPNPTNGWIDFSRPDRVSAYRLSNVQGQLLDYEASESGMRGLDMTGLPSGVYILEVLDSTKWKAIRLIKE